MNAPRVDQRCEHCNGAPAIGTKDECQWCYGTGKRTTHEPDPQIDGGLPWTRADEDRALAIADYYEDEIR